MVKVQGGFLKFPQKNILAGSLIEKEKEKRIYIYI